MFSVLSVCLSVCLLKKKVSHLSALQKYACFQLSRRKKKRSSKRRGRRGKGKVDPLHADYKETKMYHIYIYIYIYVRNGTRTRLSKSSSTTIHTIKHSPYFLHRVPTSKTQLQQYPTLLRVQVPRRNNVCQLPCTFITRHICRRNHPVHHSL